MSDFHCIVTRVVNIQKHPNADSLSMGEADGYPVIFQTAVGWREGDLCVHIPVDAVVPDTEEWAWLGGHRRIKAKRLRGIFSMGFIHPVPPGLNEGDDATAALGIEKFVPEMDLHMETECESDPGFLPVYTDIEPYRRHKLLLRPTGMREESRVRDSGYVQRTLVPDESAVGEEVVVVEKAHGANGRFLYRDSRLWVGSHHRIKRYNPQNMWWRVAEQLELETRLSQVPNIAVYGEVYGQVQDLRYDREGLHLVLFDAMDTTTRQYLDYDDFEYLARSLGLPVAPVLYRGPWSTDLLSLAEGPTVLGRGKHVREGFVVRPVRERTEHMGRVILKHVGEGYLLRKGA